MAKGYVNISSEELKKLFIIMDGIASVERSKIDQIQNIIAKEAYRVQALKIREEFLRGRGQMGYDEVQKKIKMLNKGFLEISKDKESFTEMLIDEDI